MAVKGFRTIELSDIKTVLADNKGFITVGQLVRYMKGKGKLTHYATALKRLEELAFKGFLVEEGYRTSKGYRVRWWRSRDGFKFGAT